MAHVYSIINPTDKGKDTYLVKGGKTQWGAPRTFLTSTFEPQAYLDIILI